jgi:flagellar hook-length control protein FliK
LKLLLEQQTPIVINPSSEEELLNLLDLKNISGKEKVERSPSIDFSPEEIDPKLMSFEDFLAQKNAVTKKVTSSQGYGIPQNKNLLAQMNPEVVEASNMKKPLIDGKMNSLVLNQSSSTELNPIPNSLMNNNQSLSPLTNTQTSQKVFDLSQLQNTSQDQIISQIKDYIVQAKTASEPTVNMKVQHQDLGMIDITVQKMPQEAIQIAIQTSSQDAKLFLNTHQRDLVQSLNQTGIQVSDLKIDSSSSLGKANADSSGQQQGFDQSSSGKQFGSENNQRQQDSQRRNELWKFLEEKEVA